MSDTRLTDEERDDLCDAMMDYTHTHTTSAPARLDKYVVPAVEKILAARLATRGTCADVCGVECVGECTL